MTYTYRGHGSAFERQLAEAKAAAAERQASLEDKKRQLGELRAAQRMADEFAAELLTPKAEIEPLL